MTALRVARVRAIFKLPDTFGKAVAEQTVAYVEWFTELRQLDRAVGMYEISPWMRRRNDQEYRVYSIIPVANFVRSCHLIPRWGDKKLLVQTANDERSRAHTGRFYVNTYARHSDFVYYRHVLPREQ